jgi:membrane protein
MLKRGLLMRKLISATETFFAKSLWEIEAGSLRHIRRVGVTVLRLFYKMQDEYRNGDLTIRASSLVYTTLLTFIPVLAISFAVAKGFGVHKMLAPTIYSFLEPIGDKGTEIADAILDYVEHVNVKVIGSVGLAFLLYTAINTVHQIESAFNHFWQISRPRSFLRKVRDYLTVLMAGPILMVSAIGLTTTVMHNGIVQKLVSIEPFGTTILFLTKLFPYVLIILAFTLFYYMLPNTKVHFRSALVGGTVAGVLWELLSWAFTKFIVKTTEVSAIYSGFAIVMVFMIWLYFNWLIMLMGVKVAFYHQFPAMLRMRQDRAVFSERFKYRLALSVMYLVAMHYQQNQPRWTMNALARHLKIPVAPILEVLQALQEQKLLLTLPEDGSYLPARDSDTIHVRDVLRAVELGMLGDNLFGQQICSMPMIEQMIGKLDDGIAQSLSEETVRTLLMAPEALTCETMREK